MSGPDSSESSDTPNSSAATFAVDTGLFRELGELLVGRDSTALAELVKNAYDADASYVKINGESLDNPVEAVITVEDDGTGINDAEFHRGFLRVAARTKEGGDRRSPIFGRRYTGAKGIGRLATHKLSALIAVESHANRRSSEVDTKPISATIDWDKIEQHETLDDTGDAITLRRDVPADMRLGTTLRLKRLRKVWREKDRAQFFREASSLTPPKVVMAPIPQDILPEPLLFTAPHVQDIEDPAADKGFRIEFQGDFAGGDSMWDLLASEIQWILEIRCTRESTRIAIAPSARGKKAYPKAMRVDEIIAHGSDYLGPSFDARILFRSGSIKLATLRNFAAANAGVKVYMEGFRVLPYGDYPKDDWLSIAARYISRSSQIPGTDAETSDLDDDEQADNDRPGLTIFPPYAVYGAAFLTERGAPDLQMLVNREGFVPNASFEKFVDEIVNGINILARERAAVTLEDRQRKRDERERKRREAYEAAAAAADTKDASTETTADKPRTESVNASVQPQRRTFASSKSVAHLVEDLTFSVRAARQRVAVEGAGIATSAFDELQNQIDSTLAYFRADFTEDLSLLRTLASVGTQLTIFAHEVRGLVGGVAAVEAGLTRIKEAGVYRRGSTESRKLNDVLRSVDNVRRSLERQTAYLSDSVSLDARRRRSALNPREALDRSKDLLAALIERENVSLINELSDARKTPPMFRAELQAIFTNLLTNALKAAGHGGRIWAHDDSPGLGEKYAFRFENTGKAVDITDAEKWFQPFRSTSSRPDPLLGQGIGLGLPITRSILDTYNGSVLFVSPSPGYATSVRVSFSS